KEEIRTSGGSEMKKHHIIILMAIVIGVVVAFQASRMFVRSFTPSEKQAIEIGRFFLDGVGRKTGRILSVQLEEKKPNFYWDVVVKSDVEWDRLDVWDRMLKYNRPELREIRPCWIIRFEQAKRPGHFYEVWLDVSEYIVVGGTSCM
ncbi:MAG: hypothetical protein OEY18_14670, partial [Candidatus Aminicenantes bacterium]|nr:hypothetical protein [Candidatus Aminicenantes bacterium]